MERQLGIARNLCIGLISVSLSMAAQAQTDTTYVLIRNGQEARLTFSKITNAGQYRGKDLQFPQYSMNERQFRRVTQLLERFVSMEADYESLRSIQSRKDSVSALRQSGMSEALKNASLRADNFQNAYEKLDGINQQLDEKLRECERVALANQKRNRRRSIFTGLMAGAVGLLMGAVVR